MAFVSANRNLPGFVLGVAVAILQKSCLQARARGRMIAWHSNSRSIETRLEASDSAHGENPVYHLPKWQVQPDSGAEP